jgi:mRNA interferase MazF
MLDKRRPAVVISRDDVKGARQRVTVATVTRRIRSIPSEVALGPEDGLPEPCVVNCDEIGTLDKGSLRQRIGRLSLERIEQIHRALAFALAMR